jgi:hypothetical protein
VSGVALRADGAEDWFDAAVLSARTGPAAHKTKPTAKKNPSGNFKFFMRCLPGTEGMLAFEPTRSAAPSIATPVAFARRLYCKEKRFPSQFVSRGTRP